jgi:putative ABC transport system permease protein
MFRSNLKLAFRNIFRSKLYTTINIIGLSVASAFCILVYLYVKNEQSFDSFHRDKNRLFRLEVSANEPVNVSDKSNFFSFLMKDAEETNQLVTPPILAIDLKKNLPEVENAVRLYGMGSQVVHVGNQNFKEDNNITYADEDFFEVFNFPLISGNAANVLSERNKVVISERTAQKYFGKANAVGRIFTLPNNDSLLYTVAGVAKNFPANSSFQYDIIIPLKSEPEYDKRLTEGVNTANMLVVLKLKEGTDITRFKSKLLMFSKQYYSAANKEAQTADPKSPLKVTKLYIRQFDQAHYNQSPGWDHYTNLKNIYQLVCLAVIILLIACLNYVLLTLTSAISRSQDVGIRKTIGADRKQIIVKFYTETQLLAFIAVIVGGVIAFACLPFFGQLTGTDLKPSYFSFGSIALMLFVFAAILGLVAGIYPSLTMSGLKPLSIMRGFSAYRINPVLSNGLVVVQFTICVILVISTLAINKQMHYINETNMGFDQDQVVLLQNPYGWKDRQKARELKDRIYHFAETESAIQDVTGTSFTFGAHNRNNYFINGQKTMVQFLNIDYNYFDFNKIPIVAGRNFSRNITTDSAKYIVPDPEKLHKGSSARHSIVVNQTLYKMIGKPPLGEVNSTMGGIIIGVSKDYHTDDLTKKIEPAYHTINSSDIYYYWIKIRAGQNIPKTMDKIKTNWDKMTGNLPFTYTFLDEDVAKSYEAYLRWTVTITTSCIMAIIIACLGLFGLSGLATINRTKEIGIRKVLGASVTNLFLLLNRSTISLAICSFIIATPVASYLVHQWLDNFAYRINPDWWLFTSAGIIAMLTALVAVGYHTIRAAIANPVNSLRSE